MIVKNESAVIRRCLNSAKPLIDYWVIVDTGSTDGTQQIIADCMKGIPGELYDQSWVNFEVNRNQALDLCKGKGDYVLFIDADEEFILPTDFSLTKMDKDYYLFTVHEEGENPVDYTRSLLIRNELPWRWKGVLHELVQCPSARTFELIKKCYVVSRSAEGARSQDPDKYLKDAAILEEALKENPNNSRYTFYLAQSYLNARNFAKSLKNYQKRAKMGGDEEEVFISLYITGHLQEKLELSPDTFIDSYYQAYQFRPTRAEPLYRIAEYYKQHGKILFSYLIAKHALTIPYPTDTLFVEPWIYEWGLLVTAGESAAMLQHSKEACAILEQALTQSNLPSSIRHIEEKNIKMLKNQLPSDQ